MTLWSKIVHGQTAGEIAQEDREYCKAAADCLPDVITETTWGEWTSQLKESTGRKGKGLFLPLRLALTGRRGGPSMGVMLGQLGAEKAKARLRGESA